MLYIKYKQKKYWVIFFSYSKSLEFNVSNVTLVIVINQFSSLEMMITKYMILYVHF